MYRLDRGFWYERCFHFLRPSCSKSKNFVQKVKRQALLTLVVLSSRDHTALSLCYFVLILKATSLTPPSNILDLRTSLEQRLIRVFSEYRKKNRIITKVCFLNTLLVSTSVRRNNHTDKESIRIQQVFIKQFNFEMMYFWRSSPQVISPVFSINYCFVLTEDFFLSKDVVNYYNKPQTGARSATNISKSYSVVFIYTKSEFY